MMKSLLSGLAMVAVTAGMSFAGHHEDASADAPMMIGEATSNAPTRNLSRKFTECPTLNPITAS